MGAQGQTSRSRAYDESLERVKPKLFRKYQVHKSAALGLLIPQKLQLEIRHVDRADGDLGPAYRTSHMNWWTGMTGLPAPFKLYIAHDDDFMVVKQRKSLPVVEVKPNGWQGLICPRAEVKLLQVDSSVQYEVSPQTGSTNSWAIRRPSLGRHYDMISYDYRLTWKGTTKSLSLVDDYNPNCNGNLKLESAEGELLAVWKQQRNPKVLGSIHVFEAALDQVPVEAVIASCLCIVVTEKVSGITYLGAGWRVSSSSKTTCGD